MPSEDVVTSRFAAMAGKVGLIMEAIEGVEDPATGFALKATCANVSKATYMLRLTGDCVGNSALSDFDQRQQDSLSNSLGGEVGDTPWAQARCRLGEGGVGVKTAHEVALPAVVASLTTARPAAFEWFKRAHERGVLDLGALCEAYDERVEAAQARLEAVCPSETTKAELRSMVCRGADSAEIAWAVAKAGAGADKAAPGAAKGRAGVGIGEAGGQGDGDRGDGGHRGDGVDGEDGCLEEDVADPKLPGVPKAPQLQAKLTGILDKERGAALIVSLRNAGRWADVQRLQDLKSPHQSHGWITQMNRYKGVVLPAGRWITAMRLRLGCAVLHEAKLCGVCGSFVMDEQGVHALCCAKSDSTRGHYAVRDVLAHAFAQGDAATECEVPGLIPSAPSLRPADILTRAGHERLMLAVDVMVKSPATAGVEGDCTELGKREKLDRYGPYLDELERTGIRYAPAVFSAFGRRHPDVSKMLRQAALRAARRRGGVAAEGLEARWGNDLAAVCWSRAASMVHKCIRRTQEVDEETRRKEEEVRVEEEEGTGGSERPDEAQRPAAGWAATLGGA